MQQNSRGNVLAPSTMKKQLLESKKQFAVYKIKIDMSSESKGCRQTKEFEYQPNTNKGRTLGTIFPFSTRFDTEKGVVSIPGCTQAT